MASRTEAVELVRSTRGERHRHGRDDPIPKVGGNVSEKEKEKKKKKKIESTGEVFDFVIAAAANKLTA